MCMFYKSLPPQKNSNAGRLTEDMRCAQLLHWILHLCRPRSSVFLSAGLSLFPPTSKSKQPNRVKIGFTDHRTSWWSADGSPASKRGGGCTHTFFRCHSFLWCRRTTAHSCICVFVEWKSSRIRCAVRRRLMRVYSHCSTNAAANLIITRIFHVGGTHSFGAVRISVGVQERSNSNRRWSGERPSASQLSASTAAGKKNKKTLNCVFLCFW